MLNADVYSSYVIVPIRKEFNISCDMIVGDYVKARELLGTKITSFVQIAHELKVIVKLKFMTCIEESDSVASMKHTMFVTVER
jgi:hypothetical protein